MMMFVLMPIVMLGLLMVMDRMERWLERPPLPGREVSLVEDHAPAEVREGSTEVARDVSLVRQVARV